MKILVTINDEDEAAVDMGFSNLARAICDGLCEEGVELENINVEKIKK